MPVTKEELRGGVTQIIIRHFPQLKNFATLPTVAEKIVEYIYTETGKKRPRGRPRKTDAAES